MVARVKSYKAGFVVSDSNLTEEATLADVLDLVETTGHNTVAVTDDGTPNGRLLGIVTSRDYRVSRMEPTEKVKTFMTPLKNLITAPDTTTLKEANDIHYIVIYVLQYSHCLMHILSFLHEIQVNLVSYE